jgi:hypothetical protein
VGLLTVAAFTLASLPSLRAAECIDIFEEVLPEFDVDWDKVNDGESLTGDECEEAAFASEEVDRAYEQNEANGCYNGNDLAAIEDLDLSIALMESTGLCP